MAKGLKKVTPADKYFRARNRAERLEDKLFSRLIEIAGMDPDNVDTWFIVDITFDDYDHSFEFKGTDHQFTPTKNMLKLWADLGFWRCWICYQDEGEKYYALR